MADNEDIWRALQRLDDRTTAAERSLDRHLGECSVRHAEIIRRQEESTRDRTQLRVDLAHAAEQTSGALDKLKSWVISLVITGGGVLIVGGAALILKLMKVY